MLSVAVAVDDVVAVVAVVAVVVVVVGYAAEVGGQSSA